MDIWKDCTIATPKTEHLAPTERSANKWRSVPEVAARLLTLHSIIIVQKSINTTRIKFGKMCAAIIPTLDSCNWLAIDLVTPLPMSTSAYLSPTSDSSCLFLCIGIVGSLILWDRVRLSSLFLHAGSERQDSYTTSVKKWIFSELHTSLLQN